MARISGVNLPKDKGVAVGLTYIYGIGPSRAGEVIRSAKVNPDTRVKDLSESEINALRSIIEKQFKVEGELKREILMNVKRLKETGSYRGVRHTRHLPTRGQRTKTNSRTVRGNTRKTAGSGKRKVELKKYPWERKKFHNK